MVVTTTYVETLVLTRLAAEVEDQQDDNNRVEIEEHLLEVQEGPLDLWVIKTTVTMKTIFTIK